MRNSRNRLIADTYRLQRPKSAKQIEGLSSDVLATKNMLNVNANASGNVNGIANVNKTEVLKRHSQKTTKSDRLKKAEKDEKGKPSVISKYVNHEMK